MLRRIFYGCCTFGASLLSLLLLVLVVIAVPAGSDDVTEAGKSAHWPLRMLRMLRMLLLLVVVPLLLLLLRRGEERRLLLLPVRSAGECRRGRRHRANCHEAVPPRGRRGGTGVGQLPLFPRSQRRRRRRQRRRRRRRRRGGHRRQCRGRGHGLGHCRVCRRRRRGKHWLRRNHRILP